MIPLDLQGPIKRPSDIQPEEKDVKRARSPAVENPASGKPLYLRVLEITLPVIAKLEANKLVFDGALKVWGQEFLNTALNENDYKIMCSRIFSAIHPPKLPLPCPLEQFPDAVEAVVNEKIDSIVKLINSLDVALSIYSRSPFPISSNTLKDPIVGFPLHTTLGLQSPRNMYSCDITPITWILPRIITFLSDCPYIATHPKFLVALTDFLQRTVTHPLFIEAYLDDANEWGELIQNWDKLATHHVCQSHELTNSFKTYLIKKLCSDKWRELDNDTFTKLVFRLASISRIFPRNREEIPQSEILKDNVVYISEMEKNTRLPIPLRNSCMTLLTWINGATPAEFRLKFLNGTERHLTSTEMTALTQCRYFELLFNSKMEESKEKSVLIGRDRREGDERPIGDFEQFVPTPEQMEHLITFLMGQKSLNINHHEWVALLQTADYFNLKDYLKLFQLLTPALFANDDGLADFITTVTSIVATGEPVLKGFWKVQRDILLSALLEYKHYQNHPQVLSIMLAYDAHPHYQEPWMKISSLKLEGVDAEFLNQLKKLKAITSLTITCHNLGTLNIVSRFPNPERLEISCPNFHTSNHPKLQTLKKPTPDISCWRRELTDFPNLKELHLIKVSTQANPGQYFTAQDEMNYPNLIVSVDGIIMFRGNNRKPKPPAPIPSPAK